MVAAGGKGIAPFGGGIAMNPSVGVAVALAAARTTPVAATAALDTIEEIWVDNCSVRRKVSRSRLKEEVVDSGLLQLFVSLLLMFDG